MKKTTFLEKLRSLLNFSNPSKIEGVILEKGEKVEIKIPEQLLGKHIWHITKWGCEFGDIVKPGDLICTIESENETSNFECFLHGKINYRNTSKSSLTKDTVIIEIIGV